jgi:uncharacterized protein
MRTLILFALISGPACAQQAPAYPQTTKTAKIEEIFRLMKMDQMEKQLMAQMSAITRQQTASLPGSTENNQKMIDFVAKTMSWEAMKPAYVKLYDDTYTEDEISGILMFYESPPGQAFLEKSPTLMTNTMALVQKRMAEVKPELDKMIKEMAQK